MIFGEANQCPQPCVLRRNTGVVMLCFERFQWHLTSGFALVSLLLYYGPTMRPRACAFLVEFGIGYSMRTLLFDHMNQMCNTTVDEFICMYHSLNLRML